MALAGNPYATLKEAYLQSIQKAKDADTALLEQKHNQEVEKANKNYEASARDAYVNYQKNSLELPEHLSAQGITGGASETAKVNLQTAYADALAKGNTAREGALTDLNNAYMNSLKALANQYLKQQSDAIADYDAKIAAWDEAKQAEIEAQQAAAARSYGYGGYGYSYGGGRSYGGGSASDYSDYADESPMYVEDPTPRMVNAANAVAGLFKQKKAPDSFLIARGQRKESPTQTKKIVPTYPSGAISMNYVNRGFQSFAPSKPSPKKKKGKR